MDDRGYEPRVPQVDRREVSQRSLFWPVVLIGVGVIWLLANLGVVQTLDWTVLLRLWPVLLIVIGLDILLGRRWPFVGALIGLATVALVVVLMLMGPTLGLQGFQGAGSGALETTSYAEPVDGAESANVTLGLGQGETTIGALSGSGNVLEAEMTSRRAIEWSVSGDSRKDITLRHAPANFSWLSLGTGERSDIRLNPDLPIALDISVGSGSAEMDLSELTLTELALSKGSGGASLTLPATDDNLSVRIDNGSGGLVLDVAEGAQVDMDATLGSGSFTFDLSNADQVTLDLSQGSGSSTIDVPDDAGVRVIADVSSGSLNVGGGLQRVEEGRNRNSGTWETEGFADAARQIVIELDMGSGSATIR
ncbi:MAG: LiaI-LiaF-like domain-containing protein [Anaerolineae bacterium]